MPYNDFSMPSAGAIMGVPKPPSADERLRHILDLMNGDGGFDNTAPPQSRGAGGGASLAPTPMLAPPDTGADADVFARAKDQIGQLTRGAQTAFQSVAGSKGQSAGSGFSRRGQGAVGSQGLASLSDLVREQAVQKANAINQNARTSYEGQITLRGQDLNAQAEAKRLRLAAMQPLYDLLKSAY